MMESKIFNLAKIKEVTSPIEGLQGMVSQIEKEYQKILEKCGSTIKSVKDNVLNIQIQEIIQLITKFNNQLIEISTKNLN